MSLFEKNCDVSFDYQEADGGIGSSVSKPTDKTLSILLLKTAICYGMYMVKVAVPFPLSSSSTVMVIVQVPLPGKA